MEAQCNFCEYLGVAPHCHNCTMIKQKEGDTRLPRNIKESLKEIIHNIENGKSDAYIPGDWKIIGDGLKIMVLSKCSDTLENGSLADVTFGVLEHPYICTRMNHSPTTEGGWRQCELRNHVLPIIFSSLPPILQKHIVPVVKQTGVKDANGGWVIEDTIDKLFLFSETEIQHLEYSVGNQEGVPYEFFNVRKNLESFSQVTSVWLRSTSNSRSFCCAYCGGTTTHNADNIKPFAFGFCISSRDTEDATIEATQE